MKKIISCSQAVFCTALSDRLQNRGKGLNRLDYINMKTGEDSRTVVCYKQDSQDRGLCINFCPWCGFKFDWEKGWK